MNTFAPMPKWASLVTNQAVKSGLASDPSVWSKPLSDGDWLGVPAGMTVTWDLTTCPRLGGLYVAGVLDAGSADAAKVLNVGTVFIDMDGQWLAGDCMSETPLAGTLAVKFLDLPLGPVVDPAQFAVGFLTMAAKVNMCGAAGKTAFSRVAGVHAGDMTITCLDAIQGWEVGDELLFPGLVLSPVQDEIAVVQSVSGNVVTLAAPLKFDHVPPDSRFFAYVGNLTRRIKFSSENPNGTRGHIMFMRDFASGMATMVNACHVEVRDCGRTDATRPVTDPLVDASGVLVPGTADNPRARYAWHEHRQGQSHPATTWDGIVVRGFKKVAFNNHDSIVNASNLVAYDGQGTCFFTERGTELGAYRTSLGVRTSGVPGSTPTGEDRLADQDFGFNGFGAWLQGPMVELTNNVLLGHADAGVAIYCRGPVSGPLDGSGTLTPTFPRANIPASFNLGSWVTQDPKISFVPLLNVSDNVSAGCGSFGHVLIWSNPLANTTAPFGVFSVAKRSEFARPVAFNCPTGSRTLHSLFTKQTNPILVGPNFAPGSFGIPLTFGYDRDNLIENPDVSGFEVGIQVGSGLQCSGGTLANVYDFDDVVGLVDADAVISSLPVFGDVSQMSLGTRQRMNFRSAPYKPTANTPPSGITAIDVNRWFWPVHILLPNGQQLYKAEQAADYVPFKTTDARASDYPSSVLGLTNAQLRQAFGESVGDQVANNPTTPSFITNGIVAAAQSARTIYILPSGSKTFTAAYQDSDSVQLHLPSIPNGLVYTDPSPVPLQAGWNALSRTINGEQYTFFVYSTAAAPTNPPAAMISADVQALLAGQATTLHWTSTNATSATLNGQPVALSGSLAVSPQATTTYRLVVSNGTQTAEADVTVTVQTLEDLLIAAVPTLTAQNASDVVKIAGVLKANWGLI